MEGVGINKNIGPFTDKNGWFHGPREQWSKNGTLYFKCTYVHGEIEGLSFERPPWSMSTQFSFHFNI